jgi:hypothetical protein
LGFSFNRRLAEQRFNIYGADLTWNVRAIPLDLRAEWLRSTGRGGGYWIEGAYRLRSLSRSAFLRRSQIVLRGEQFFSSADADTAASISDLYGVPLTDTQRLMWGWNYSLREGWRINASYGRQLSISGNSPLWTAGVSYHFGI